VVPQKLCAGLIIRHVKLLIQETDSGIATYLPYAPKRDIAYILCPTNVKDDDELGKYLTKRYILIVV